jgi:hypothetical protein
MYLVDSSSIDAIGYDAESQELHIRFLKSGETYVYYAVEERTFAELMEADSKGIYLNTRIKPHYRYERL